MPINIRETSNVPADKRREIADYLIEAFQKSVTARSTQIDSKYQTWLDNYNAKPAQEVRSSPFPNASNFVPQLIRMHVDILTARLVGILFGTRPFWRPTTFLSAFPTDKMQSLAAWMQYITFNRMQLYPVFDAIVHEGFRTPATVVKGWWDERSLWTPTGDFQDGKMQSEAKNAADAKLDVVPFEDFYPYPITAKNVSLCEILFHRLRLTGTSVKFKRDNGVWDREACEVLLTGKSAMGGSNAQTQELLTSGISLTPDVGAPYDAVEAHFNYTLEPGKQYPLIAVFNPKIKGEKALLRLYYKPGSDVFGQAFTDFRFMPKNNSFYGGCIPAILQDSQEEQAQIHNARRDANKIANVPAWKKKRYADVANPSQEWYPGKVFEVDNMDDLVPLSMGVNYNAMVDEEQFLLTLAERYTGVSPAMQGMGAGVNGKRGTYASQGTLAMIAEGNRRIDVYLKRCRVPFNSVGRFIFTSYRDFGDTQEWQAYGEHGKNILDIFRQDGALNNGRTFFELSASDAGANRETDRSGLLLMANTMSSYYHELVQAAQMVVSQPDGSPAKELMLQVLDGARDLANRLLFVFDIGDREKLLPDLRKVLGGGAGGPGGPSAGPGASLVNGLPEPSAPVSIGGVQDLASNITALARANGSGVPQ